MGTSLALGVKHIAPTINIDAIETSPAHRDDARSLGVFRRMFEQDAEVTDHYDLIVLAVPPATACNLLTFALSHSEWTLDLCSIKQPLCTAVVGLPRAAFFVPSHPMAGRAIGGPRGADATLFRDRPWLFLSTNPPSGPILDLVQAIGARPVMIPDASTHDEMMASVSHGIHLTSLAAMRASDAAASQTASVSMMSAISGPAFWDITRLASSPSAFWVDTLVENREAVRAYLHSLQLQLSLFDEALASSDAADLQVLLDEAREARSRWEKNETKH